MIMADYSSEVQAALAYAYPEAAIKGYWFLYTSDVLTFVKQHDLHNQLTRGHGASALRMLLVLPLLPAEYMKPGLDGVRAWAREKYVSPLLFERCCTYVEQSWLRRIGAGRMSIFGLPHGVYNHLQTFNRDVKGMLNENTSLWSVLETITTIATRTYAKYSNNQKSVGTKQRPLNKRQHELDTIVRNATQMWIRTPVHLRNPLQFLQLASHCINVTPHSEGFDDCTNTNGGELSNATPSHSETFAEHSVSKMPKLVATTSSSERHEIAWPVLTETTTHATTTTTASLSAQLRSTDPPPLVFFPKSDRSKPILFSATEPPPLVPLRRRPKS